MGLAVLILHTVVLYLVSVNNALRSNNQSHQLVSGEIISQPSKAQLASSDRAPLLKNPPRFIKEFVSAFEEGQNLVQENSGGEHGDHIPSAASQSLNNPKPPYPISSRENGEQGYVVLSACISQQGLIERLELLKSSGYIALDRSALNTVRNWKFRTATSKGINVPMCYRLPINFVLTVE
ncbi:TonB family C-terminal domain-containing protein [Polynucleobacter meluiroseus]|uniref:TonB family C-terminal domain-containing protein n=2 Tax=Polynucleobacter meluiroseus TaxID=1938814 RepID=A0A240DY54_9BURK|nr:TonB family C-terminal domain-containing protein [Polynucleobacter meluiroseus]